MGARFGQHFLRSAKKLHWIVSRVEPSGGDDIIEVGCGRGEMTAYLVKEAGTVLGVEIDPVLFASLNERFGSLENVRLVNADFLKWQGPNDDKTYRLVGNLPYYAATAIIDQVVGDKVAWSDAHFLIQREVALRICSPPGRRQRGWFSLWVQSKADATILGDISPKAFWPRPRVNSSLLRLERFEEPMIAMEDREGWRRFLHACFAQKRKTLLNNLCSAFGGKFTKEQLKGMIGNLGIDELVRAEALELGLMLDLFNRFVRVGAWL